jgi:hypothetical protein
MNDTDDLYDTDDGNCRSSDGGRARLRGRACSAFMLVAFKPYSNPTNRLSPDDSMARLGPP